MVIKKFNFKNISSTNDKAINIIKKTNNKFGLVVSENQKKGRGQYGKKWISIKGNIFMSIFFSLDKIDMSIKELTKTNCFLVKKILSKYTRKKITIKYPNDLLINKKKICGILQEILNKSNTKFIIVGIGINLTKSPKIKGYPTTNFLEVTNSRIKKESVITDLIKIYQKFLNSFINLNKLKRS